jgi:CRISPR/Cas system-associated protein Csm6
MKTIITTVGTSILENYSSTDVKDCIQESWQPIGTYLKDIKDKSISSADYNNFDIEIDEIKPIIFDNWFKGIHKVKNEKGEWKWKKEINVLNQNASAEIASILAIAQAERKIKVHLIATDTVLSVLAAELIKAWFDASAYDFEVDFIRPEKLESQKDSSHIIHQLRISSNEDYQEGFMNLVEVLTELIKKDNTILNITGGYKAIIPIMTLIGQIKNVPLKYIYEESNLNDKTELVEVGKLPINFDWGILENYTNLIFDTSKIIGRKIRELESIGIIKKDISPVELTIIGKMLKIFLEQDVPFQKTTLGYLVEYKLYEYYLKNNYSTFHEIELGFPLSDLPENYLEDADLWMENEAHEIVMVEVKPATIKSRALRKKIEKNLDFVQAKNIKEFWVILYEYSDNIIDNNVSWSNQVMNEEIKEKYPNLIFKIKKITLQKNEIDGNLNRTIYQNFMRKNLSGVDDIFSSKKN